MNTADHGDSIVGLFLVFGAALGVVAGLLVAGGAGIALGAAAGAGAGVTVAAMVDMWHAHRGDERRSR